MGTHIFKYERREIKYRTDIATCKEKEKENYYPLLYLNIFLLLSTIYSLLRKGLYRVTLLLLTTPPFAPSPPDGIPYLTNSDPPIKNNESKEPKIF